RDGLSLVPRTASFSRRNAMWFPSWLPDLFCGFPSVGGRPRRPSPGERTPRRPTRVPRVGPFRPALEALEHRDLPSTCVVTNPSDTGGWGDGSLRGEILAAASGDQIVFAPGLAGQTITLTSGTELYLAKDLTIQGLVAGLLTVRGCGSRVFEIAPG